MKMDINRAELVIDGKYKIKPLMTVEEIKKSNLKDILDEKSKIQLEEDPTQPLFIRRNIYGEEVNVRLHITKEKLTGIYILVGSEDSDVVEATTENSLNPKPIKSNTNNMQIHKIEGIDEVEYKKIQELCDIYGKFPSEENLVESIKNLQSKVKSISEQINQFSEEKIKLEAVEKAFKVIDENSVIYNKYEASGFNKDILKDNENSIDQYEKAKELLKITDNKDKMDLGKRIENHKKKIEKLEKTKNSLIMENNKISDSYSAHQKYKDIGTNNLDQLKKELLCYLKAKDELNYVFIHNDDKRAQEFWTEKKIEIDLSINNLDTAINTIGITDKHENDDNIDYMKQKISDEKRYLKENYSLNNSHKENEIKEITKNAMEEINPSASKKLSAINDLYNIENKIDEIQKELNKKQDVTELDNEAKIIEIAKEKLELIDKFKPIMEIMDKYKNNKYFKKFNENKYGSEIEKYTEAKNDLELMEINNWEKYKEAKNIYDEKTKSLLEDKGASGAASLDNTEAFRKIAKYKNKQNEIIKKYSN